jgi:hypothetical protein
MPAAVPAAAAMLLLLLLLLASVGCSSPDDAPIRLPALESCNKFQGMERAAWSGMRNVLQVLQTKQRRKEEVEQFIKYKLKPVDDEQTRGMWESSRALEDLQAELAQVSPAVAQLEARAAELWAKILRGLPLKDGVQLDDHYHCFMNRLAPVSHCAAAPAGGPCSCRSPSRGTLCRAGCCARAAAVTAACQRALRAGQRQGGGGVCGLGRWKSWAFTVCALLCFDRLRSCSTAADADAA